MLANSRLKKQEIQIIGGIMATIQTMKPTQNSVYQSLEALKTMNINGEKYKLVQQSDGKFHLNLIPNYSFQKHMHEYRATPTDESVRRFNQEYINLSTEEKAKHEAGVRRIRNLLKTTGTPLAAATVLNGLPAHMQNIIDPPAIVRSIDEIHDFESTTQKPAKVEEEKKYGKLEDYIRQSRDHRNPVNRVSKEDLDEINRNLNEAFTKTASSKARKLAEKYAPKTNTQSKSVFEKYRIPQEEKSSQTLQRIMNYRNNNNNQITKGGSNTMPPAVQPVVKQFLPNITPGLTNGIPYVQTNEVLNGKAWETKSYSGPQNNYKIHFVELQGKNNQGHSFETEAFVQKRAQGQNQATPTGLKGTYQRDSRNLPIITTTVNTSNYNLTPATRATNKSTPNSTHTNKTQKAEKVKVEMIRGGYEAPKQEPFKPVPVYDANGNEEGIIFNNIDEARQYRKQTRAMNEYNRSLKASGKIEARNIRRARNAGLMGDVFRRTSEGISSFTGGVGDLVGGIGVGVGNALTAASNSVDYGVATLTNTVDNIVDNASQAISTGITTVDNLASTAIDLAGKGASAAIQLSGKTINTGLNVVEGTVNTGLDVVNKGATSALNVAEHAGHVAVGAVDRAKDFAFDAVDNINLGVQQGIENLGVITKESQARKTIKTEANAYERERNADKSLVVAQARQTRNTITNARKNQEKEQKAIQATATRIADEGLRYEQGVTQEIVKRGKIAKKVQYNAAKNTEKIEQAKRATIEKEIKANEKATANQLKLNESEKEVVEKNIEQQEAEQKKLSLQVAANESEQNALQVKGALLKLETEEQGKKLNLAKEYNQAMFDMFNNHIYYRQQMALLDVEKANVLSQIRINEAKELAQIQSSQMQEFTTESERLANIALKFAKEKAEIELNFATESTKNLKEQNINTIETLAEVLRLYHEHQTLSLAEKEVEGEIHKDIVQYDILATLVEKLGINSIEVARYIADTENMQKRNEIGFELIGKALELHQNYQDININSELKRMIINVAKDRADNLTLAERNQIMIDGLKEVLALYNEYEQSRLERHEEQVEFDLQAILAEKLGIAAIAVAKDQADNINLEENNRILAEAIENIIDKGERYLNIELEGERQALDLHEEKTAFDVEAELIKELGRAGIEVGKEVVLSGTRMNELTHGVNELDRSANIDVNHAEKIANIDVEHAGKISDISAKDAKRTKEAMQTEAQQIQEKIRLAQGEKELVELRLKLAEQQKQRATENPIEQPVEQATRAPIEQEAKAPVTQPVTQPVKQESEQQKPIDLALPTEPPEVEKPEEEDKEKKGGDNDPPKNQKKDGPTGYDEDLISNRMLAKEKAKNIFEGKVEETELGFKYESRYVSSKIENGKPVEFVQKTYIASPDKMGNTLLNVMSSENNKTVLSIKEQEAKPAIEISKKALNKEIINQFKKNKFVETKDTFTVPVNVVKRTDAKVIKFSIEGTDLTVDVDAKNIIFAVQDKDKKTITHVYQPEKNNTFNFQINTELTNKMFDVKNTAYLFTTKKGEVTLSGVRNLNTVSGLNYFDPKELLAMAMTADETDGARIYNKGKDKNNKEIYPKILYTKIKDINHRKGFQHVLLVKTFEKGKNKGEQTFLFGHFPNSAKIQKSQKPDLSLKFGLLSNNSKLKSLSFAEYKKASNGKPYYAIEFCSTNHSQCIKANITEGYKYGKENLAAFKAIRSFVNSENEDTKNTNNRPEEIGGIEFAKKDNTPPYEFDSYEKFDDFYTVPDREKTLEPPPPGEKVNGITIINYAPIINSFNENSFNKNSGNTTYSPSTSNTDSHDTNSVTYAPSTSNTDSHDNNSVTYAPSTSNTDSHDDNSTHNNSSKDDHSSTDDHSINNSYNNTSTVNKDDKGGKGGGTNTDDKPKKQKGKKKSLFGPLSYLVMATGAILMALATIFGPLFAAIGIFLLALGAAMKALSFIKWDDAKVLEKAITDHKKEKSKAGKEAENTLSKYKNLCANIEAYNDKTAQRNKLRELYDLSTPEGKDMFAKAHGREDYTLYKTCNDLKKSNDSDYKKIAEEIKNGDVSYFETLFAQMDPNARSLFLNDFNEQLHEKAAQSEEIKNLLEGFNLPEKGVDRYVKLETPQNEETVTFATPQPEAEPKIQQAKRYKPYKPTNNGPKFSGKKGKSALNPENLVVTSEDPISISYEVNPDNPDELIQVYKTKSGRKVSMHDPLTGKKTITYCDKNRKPIRIEKVDDKEIPVPAVEDKKETPEVKKLEEAKKLDDFRGLSQDTAKSLIDNSSLNSSEKEELEALVNIPESELTEDQKKKMKKLLKKGKIEAPVEEAYEPLDNDNELDLDQIHADLENAAKNDAPEATIGDIENLLETEDYTAKVSNTLKGLNLIGENSQEQGQEHKGRKKDKNEKGGKGSSGPSK